MYLTLILMQIASKLYVLLIIIQLQYLNIKMDSRESLQKEIRESFELAYKERLLTMKNFYQMRYQTLQDTIANSYRKVIQDQILTTMIRDTTTVNFIQDRVKQLFKQIVENQREVLIQKLGIQYSQLKFHYQQIEKKYLALKKQSENTQHKNYKQRISTQSEKSQFSEVLRKKQQQIFQLKLELKEKASIIKEKQRNSQDLQTKLSQAKEENVYLKIKLEKFEEQVNEAIGVQKTKFQLKDVDLQESQKKLSLLQNTMKEMEKVNQQKIELIEKKYRKKVAAYQAKIQQYKAIIKDYAESKPKTESYQQYQLRIQQLEKKMLVVSREAQKKVSEYRSQKEKDKIELEKRYQNKYRQLQSYYEKLVEEKIDESERVAYEAAQRIKSEEEEIRKYVLFLQENSVPCQQFFSLQKNADSLRIHYQGKCSEMQNYVNQLSGENKHLKMNYEQIKKREQEIDEKFRINESSLTETSNKLKLCQQQISQMKNGEKKFKALLTDLQSNLRSKQEEVLNLRNEVHKIRSQNAQYIGTISERQSQYLQKCQQAQQMERKINKFATEIETLKQEEEKKQMNLNNFKRLIMQKENQISSISQEFQYKVQGLNSQIHKQDLVINSQIERIKELGEKFSTTDNGLSQVLKQRGQIEAMCRKLELQNKFIKQSEEAFRMQHQIYINDFKKKIEEKNLLIDQLKSQMNEQKRHHNQQVQGHEANIRKLSNTLRKIHRMYWNQIDNIRRTLKDTKIYVESIDKLFKSEVKMIEGSTILKIKEEMLIMSAQKSEQVRKLKQDVEYEKAQHLQSNKTKSERLQTQFKEKLQSQIRNYESQLSSKQKQMEKMQKQRKKHSVEKQELCETIKIGQKKLRQLELAFENEKIQNKSKISEIVRSFDNEKNKIIQDYEGKRQHQEEQISELATSFKNLRKELEYFKMMNEQQKNKLISEQKQFTRKEKQLEREVEKKKRELQNLRETMQTSKESSRKLEFEIRSLIDKNSSLTQLLAESELKSHQITGQLSIFKAKIDRLTQENEHIKKQLAQIKEQKQSIEMSKKKMDSQLKEIKYTINRSNKSHQLRALQQLDQETRQLSSKVSQLKKVNLLMSHQKTPLRS